MNVCYDVENALKCVEFHLGTVLDYMEENVTPIDIWTDVAHIYGLTYNVIERIKNDGKE